jgi:hypothetical protein
LSFQPGDGLAISRTEDALNVLVQVRGHEMPAGELVTLPLPETATVARTLAFTKCAVALAAADIEIVHAGVVLLQEPLQLENAYPAAGTAITESVVPLSSAIESHPCEQGRRTVFARAEIVPGPSTAPVKGNCGKCSSQSESCTSHHELLCP